MTHKLILLIALFAVAQMVHLTQEAHEMIEMHDSKLDITHGHFPQKIRFAYAHDPDYGLYPNAENIRLQLIRDVQHNDTDKSKWMMIKNSDGSFGFQTYDGRKMKCPNQPNHEHSITLTHPGTSINQKFEIETVNAQNLTYRVRCKEGSIQPAITSRGYDKDVYLSRNFGTQNVWIFRTS